MTPRATPRLAFYLPVEGPGTLQLEVATHEDELRLRTWLRRARELADLQASIQRLLDDLDEQDRARAA